MSNDPLVSIGVPVYNDAPWLHNALDHLLNQDYRNLEIIIADDGSTDGSRQICREYAKRDKRIRLFENKHNLKAHANHKFVFDVSIGDYFTWGSGHDYYHLSFISKTLRNLQANPAAVMCCTQSLYVGEKRQPLKTTKEGLDMHGLPPIERFRKLMDHITSGGTANIFYGLYRHDALGQKPVFRTVGGWDIIMLAELSLLGEINKINEVLHYRMLNYNESRPEHAARHTKMLFDMPGFLPERYLYRHESSREFLNMVVNSQFSKSEKQKLYDDVIEFDVSINRAAKSKEMDDFVDYSRMALDAVLPHPQMAKYRAARVLNVLDQARLLSFYSDDMWGVKSTCLSALELDTEAKIASLEEKLTRIATYIRHGLIRIRTMLLDVRWLGVKARRVLHIIKSLLVRNKRNSI